MFPQVLISALRGSTKRETDAPDSGVDLHSVRKSASEAEGGKHLTESWTSTCPITPDPPPSAVTGSARPNLSDLSSPLICWFPLGFPPSEPSLVHMRAPSAGFITLPILFQYFYLGFYSTPLPPLFPPISQISPFHRQQIFIGYVSQDSSPILSPHAGKISRDEEKEVSFVTAQVNI